MTTLSPQQFVAKWRHATLKERSAAQSHFNDLCALLGQPTPAEADPAGRWFTFEAGASQTAGGQGWADVWKMGHFAWEYKGQHADLDKAYRQLLQYRESLLNPPLLIVSDLQRIIIHTNFTNTVKRIYELTLDDLLIPDKGKLDLLRKAFTDPDRLRPGLTPSQVTEEAAASSPAWRSLLRRYGNEPHATAHFLIRLLFLPVRRGCGHPARRSVYEAGDAAPPGPPGPSAVSCASSSRPWRAAARSARTKSRWWTAACSTTTARSTWTATACTSWPR